MKFISKSKRIAAILAVTIVGMVSLDTRAQDPSFKIEEVLTPERFSECGLHKLSGEELGRLNVWMSAYLVEMAGLIMRADGRYFVELSHNDELFVINGEKFEARTYCFDVEEGDVVIFIDGSAYGACASAAFVNLRTKELCEVWCE